MVREIEYAQSLPQVAGDTFVLLYGPRPVEHDPNEEDDEDRVVAYDLRTGEEQWRYVFDECKWTHDVISAIAVDDDTVYLERDGELLALRSETEAPDDPEGDDPGNDEQDGSEDEDQQDGEDDTDKEEDECSCPDDDPADEDGGSSSDDGESVDGDDGDIGNGNDGNGNGGNGTDAGNETDAGNGNGGNGTGAENETDTGNNSDADNVPGFTAGGGLLGGALGFEWLRRKAGVDESTSVNEPSE